VQSLYKNERQIRFGVLMEEMKKLGLKPAHVAKLIRKSRATVSQILAGEQTPSPTTLDLFERVAAEKSGRAPESQNKDEVQTKLEDLKQNDPNAYEQAKNNIEFLHDRMSPAKSSSSGDRQKIEKLAVQTGQRHIASYRAEKRRAGNAIGSKSPSTRESRPSKGSESPLPEPGPKQHQ
jgi:transcriptional regulator with XRE-family HTH domain